MTALPDIPPWVQTIDYLETWIAEAAPKAETIASRMRLAVAVMDRAAAIGERQRETT